MSACISSNEKLGIDVVVIFETTYNETVVDLAAYRYLSYNGSIRCVCHTMALATNTGIGMSSLLTDSPNRIIDIANYINTHPKVARKLAAMK